MDQCQGLDGYDSLVHAQWVANESTYPRSEQLDKSIISMFLIRVCTSLLKVKVQTCINLINLEVNFHTAKVDPDGILPP